MFPKLACCLVFLTSTNRRAQEGFFFSLFSHQQELNLMSVRDADQSYSGADCGFQMFSGMQAKQTLPPRGPQECQKGWEGGSSDLRKGSC